MHPETWNQSEFMSFLLTYGSKVDGKIAPEEINLIIEYFGKDTYQTILAVLEKQSDFENVQTIINLKEKLFPGASGKEYILKLLQELFVIDNHFHIIERAVLNALNRLI